jgi:hypothetical protein
MTLSLGNRPKYEVMEANYPADEDPQAVKSAIGGGVDASWITNTCAVRLSQAFNYSGLPLPRKFTGMLVVTGGDLKRYAVRQLELRKWIAFEFGPPDLTRTKPKGGTINRDDFKDVKGVIGFDIHFKDATGHVDLWDGSTFMHEPYAGRDYFALANRVVLWKLP